MRVAHRAGIGVGVVLLVALVVAAVSVGYRFYSHTAKPFRFHYFKVSFLLFSHVLHFLPVASGCNVPNFDLTGRGRGRGGATGAERAHHLQPSL